MKRFLLLFCAVVLVCSIMIVPALAADDSSLTVSGLDCYDSFSGYPWPNFRAGDYVLKIYTGSDELFYTSPSFTLTADKCFEGYLDGVSSRNYTLEGFFCIESSEDTYSLDLAFNVCTNDECVSWADFFPPITKLEFIPAVSDPEPVSPVAGIFGVFSGVGSWLAGQLGTTTSLFWNGQGLTFLGVLSVSGLALAVVLLLVMVVVRFLRFRG